MSNSPNLHGREEQWRLQLLCIPWQPDRWNNPHTRLRYQPAPVITWQQTGRPWEAAGLREAPPWQPQMVSGQIPDFPAGLSSALLRLTNFTSVLHWLHICNCTLSSVRRRIWLRVMWKKDTGAKEKEKGKALSSANCGGKFAGQRGSASLKVTDGRLFSSFCKKPSPSASPRWEDSPPVSFQSEGKWYFHNRIYNYSLISQ